MNKSARKILLPSLVVTEIANETDLGAQRIDLPCHGTTTTYYVRPKRFGGATDGAEWFNEKTHGTGFRFNLFPIVLGSDGVPWAEANVYLLSRLKDAVRTNMTTYAGIADDLAMYRWFLDEMDVDWMSFPQNKLYRPTYRYNGYLRHAVEAGEMAASSAKRRMSTVISFYKHMNKLGLLNPKYPPWKESDRYIEIKGDYGANTLKRITTTDISINVPKQVDPYNDAIDDGGQLRPLSQEEQEWLIDALITYGNTEMTLIHLMAILTGARIQTILTFRVRHVIEEIENITQTELRIPVGPGTGIDTKYNKKMVLHIPAWFYLMLKTYAYSERARKRRKRAIGGDYEEQYLFLSIRGVPLYHSKEDSRNFNEFNTLRHRKTGQGVRQFITERIIPFIRTKYKQPKFHYRFHDTRATYGMNLTDDRLNLVTQGKMVLSEVREFVKTRMGHNSAITTDRYLNYRKNLKLARQANMQYEDHLKTLAEKAMEGLL